MQFWISSWTFFGISTHLVKNIILDATVLDVYRLLSGVEKQAAHATVLRSIQLSVTHATGAAKDVYSLTLSVYTPRAELAAPPAPAEPYLLQHVLTTDQQVAKLLVAGEGEEQEYHRILHDFAVQPEVRLAKLQLLAAA